MADTTKVLRADNTYGALIPEVFSHIVSNPELNKRHNKRETIMMNLNEIPEEEENFGTPETESVADRYRKRATTDSRVFLLKRQSSQGNQSIKSNEFKSCLSGDSSVATLNVMEIQQTSQIFCRVIIEEKQPDCQKVDIDFIFSEFRIVISLPTIQQVLKFT